jgi:hypothetical protein
MTDSSSSSRHRGAQPGNQNALKHGFYAAKFTEADRQDADTFDYTGLVDEVMLLRVFIRRVVEQSSTVTDVDDTLRILRALSLASASITRLMRVQKAELTPYKELGNLNDLFRRAMAVANALPSAEKLTSSAPAAKDP